MCLLAVCRGADNSALKGAGSARALAGGTVTLAPTTDGVSVGGGKEGFSKGNEEARPAAWDPLGIQGM